VPGTKRRRMRGKCGTRSSSLQDTELRQADSVVEGHALN
jgi:hypothetical protein